MLLRPVAAQKVFMSLPKVLSLKIQRNQGRMNGCAAVGGPSRCFHRPFQGRFEKANVELTIGVIFVCVSVCRLPELNRDSQHLTNALGVSAKACFPVALQQQVREVSGARQLTMVDQLQSPVHQEGASLFVLLATRKTEINTLVELLGLIKLTITKRLIKLRCDFLFSAHCWWA